MEDLYQEIILDHYRNPQGRGLREPFESQVHHVNPTCGDEIDLRVHLVEEDGVTKVADVSYAGQGCSISQASRDAVVHHARGRLRDGAPLTRIGHVRNPRHAVLFHKVDAEVDFVTASGIDVMHLGIEGLA